MPPRRDVKIADKKKNNRILSSEQKFRLLALREQKQVARFLLPDAPKKKQKRKVSPSRIPCPLTAGTPSIPPARQQRPWEVKGDKPGPSTRIATHKDVAETVEETVVEETEVEETPSMKRCKLLFSTTGIQTMEEIGSNALVNADIELVGFTPETSIFDENEYQIAEWEQNIEQNPGSDIDEDGLDTDIPDIGVPRSRNVEEYPADLNNLSPDLLQQINALDARDDSALRELVSSKDMLNFAWSSDATTFTGKREQFTGPSGPTFSIEGMTPLDIFQKIWDETIINLITIETNRYANHLLDHSNLSQHSRLKRWNNITKKDLWTFFAIIMLQSFVPNPVEKEYWYPQFPYLKIGNFNDIMSFRQFALIKKCIHFVDNNELVHENQSCKGSRLHKVKPILEHLNRKFSSLYIPEQNIAIDESLLLWKGRLSFSQVIATKAARVGIKSYELCESRTGYLWMMEVYTGKGHHQETEEHDVETQSNEPEGTTSQIVYRLVRPLLDKGHTLTMDNFYNSPLLSRTLKSRKTDTIGTLRLNREFVPECLRNKTKTNMRIGEIAFSQTQDLSIVVWRDSNLVSLISTYHKVEISGNEKHGFYKYKPKVVQDYNLSMGGVDKKDQLLQAFPVERIRNMVWYKKLFRRLLNVSIHNAYIIFTHKNKIPQRQFRIRLAEEILKKYNPSRVPLPAQVPAQVPQTGHFPVKASSSRMRCKQCARNKISSRTVYACDTCEVSLCINECFKNYHISHAQL